MTPGAPVTDRVSVGVIRGRPEAPAAAAMPIDSSAGPSVTSTRAAAPVPLTWPPTRAATPPSQAARASGSPSAAASQSASAPGPCASSASTGNAGTAPGTSPSMVARPRSGSVSGSPETSACTSPMTRWISECSRLARSVTVTARSAGAAAPGSWSPVRTRPNAGPVPSVGTEAVNRAPPSATPAVWVPDGRVSSSVTSTVPADEPIRTVAAPPAVGCPNSGTCTSAWQRTPPELVTSSRAPAPASITGPSGPITA